MNSYYFSLIRLQRSRLCMVDACLHINATWKRGRAAAQLCPLFYIHTPVLYSFHRVSGRNEISVASIIGAVRRTLHSVEVIGIGLYAVFLTLRRFWSDASYFATPHRRQHTQLAFRVMRGKWINACRSHCIYVGSTRMRMFVYTVVVAQTRDTVGCGTRDRQLRSLRTYVIRRVRVHGTRYRMRSRLFLYFYFDSLFCHFYFIWCVTNVCVRLDGSVAMIWFFFSPFFVSSYGALAAAAIFMGGKTEKIVYGMVTVCTLLRWFSVAASDRMRNQATFCLCVCVYPLRVFCCPSRSMHDANLLNAFESACVCLRRDSLSILRQFCRCPCLSLRHLACRWIFN